MTAKPVVNPKILAFGYFFRDKANTLSLIKVATPKCLNSGENNKPGIGNKLTVRPCFYITETHPLSFISGDYSVTFSNFFTEILDGNVWQSPFLCAVQNRTFPAVFHSHTSDVWMRKFLFPFIYLNFLANLKYNFF